MDILIFWTIYFIIGIFLSVIGFIYYIKKRDIVLSDIYFGLIGLAFWPLYLVMFMVINGDLIILKKKSNKLDEILYE